MPVPLSVNSQLLVDHLQSLPELDGRFTNISLANYDPVHGKRGSFSLVFRAHDKLENRLTALKFYDPDPLWSRDKYRQGCFQREAEILRSLVNVERCVQLVKPLDRFDLPVPVSGAAGAKATISCDYFALEWLDGKIDHYFLEQGKFDALEKLALFNEILLAIEALHRHKVFHRDLKFDNFRAYTTNGRRIVVAIDLGTAAKYSSGRLPSAPYPHGPVGHLFWASPEALHGLASNRKLAPCCDRYALGCLLFELFNHDICFRAIRNVTPDYDLRLSAMMSLVTASAPDEVQVAEWESGLKAFASGVTPVLIDGAGTSVPPGIAPILGELVAGLTHIDFRRRPDLATARRKVWTAITVLKNQRIYDRKLRERRELRRRRIQKLEEKRKRLQLRLPHTESK